MLSTESLTSYQTMSRLYIIVFLFFISDFSQDFPFTIWVINLLKFVFSPALVSGHRVTQTRMAAIGSAPLVWAWLLSLVQVATAASTPEDFTNDLISDLGPYANPESVLIVFHGSSTE